MNTVVCTCRDSGCSSGRPNLRVCLICASPIVPYTFDALAMVMVVEFTGTMVSLYCSQVVITVATVMLILEDHHELTPTIPGQRQQHIDKDGGDVVADAVVLVAFAVFVRVVVPADAVLAGLCEVLGRLLPKKCIEVELFRP